MFTGIYQDEDHPNPSQAYNMLKSYISYYNFSNDVLESKQLILNSFTSYDEFFLSKLEELPDQNLELLHEKLIDMDKSMLSFEQMLAFRVA